MTETLDQDRVARFIAARHGADAGASVAALGAGDWSWAFSFCADGQELVVRFGRHVDDFIKDRQAMDFAGPDLPIPKVLQIGEALGMFYAVSERHFGVFLETLNVAEWQRILPALLRSMDALRETRFESGVDWASATPGKSLSWREWLLASLEDRPGNRVSGWRMVLGESMDIEQIFVAGESALRARLPSCPEVRHLLHRDLLNRNVLVAEDASQLEAVFDWGCSLAGDFLYDAAWLTFWAPWYPALETIDFRRELCEHYQRIGLIVDHFDERLSCYELQIGLEHIAYATFTRRPDQQQRIARRTQDLLTPS